MNDTVRGEYTSHIAASFALLKNVFSPSEIVHYVLAIAFLRWLSELNQVQEGESRVTIFRSPSCLGVDLFLPPRGELRQLDLSDNAASLGRRTNALFKELEDLNPLELSGVFRGLDFSSEKFDLRMEKCGLLRELINYVDDAQIKIKGELGLTKVLSKYLAIAADSLASGLYSPEFNTPQSICNLVSKIVRPVMNESVYDPTCGSGQLLLACGIEATKDMDVEVVLAGGEINHSAWALAKLNILSHGFSTKTLLLADSLDVSGVPTLNGEQCKFDVVVAHPPWSVRTWQSEHRDADRFGRFSRGVPPRANADYAFILHMISAMRKHSGRMAAIVSSGVLTRTGTEGQIRQRLIEENLVDAVIGLPEKLFQGTPIAGAILVLRMNRKTKDVLFVDAQTLADFGRSRNFLSDHAVQRIAEICETRSSIPQTSAVATYEDIFRNGFSLSIPLYVQTLKYTDSRPLAEIRAERMQTQIELEAICEEIGNELEILTEK